VWRSVIIQMKKTHVNIPVFIPHLGCPNMCVFCNQRAISGVCSFIPENAEKTIETALSSLGEMADKTEIAFFGGSFTGIDRELMVTLLDLAEKYVREGRVSGIRMSTRPDYIDDEIINILKNYTVRAVELGIQSTSDAVLRKSKRGHTAECSFRAMTMLKEAGFDTVGQMMIGLPGSSAEDEIKTARDICSLGAAGARIYPTIVFRDTELSDMTERGEYTPLTVDEAVVRSASALEIFAENNVECIRIGLCDSENLHSEETYYAGPNHPALGELIIGEVYYRKIREALDKYSPVNGVRISVPKGEISAAVGHKRTNKIRIENEYNVKNIKFIEKDSLPRYNIEITYD
ncbi:MAG: elongator complex protein 3, partial [Eubacteriales bacterium]